MTSTEELDAASAVLRDLVGRRPSEIRQRFERDNMGEVIDALRVVGGSEGEVSGTAVVGSVRALLAALAEQGVSGLDRSDAEQLAGPTLTLIKRRGLASQLREELVELNVVRDFASVKFLASLLAEVLVAAGVAPDQSPPPMAEIRPEPPATEDIGSPSAPAAGALLTDLLAGVPLAIGGFDRKVIEEVAAAWAGRRLAVLREARSRSDAWLLQTSILTGALLPISLAEGLFLDEEVWEEEGLAQLAGARQRPFHDDEVGMAAAAFLNSRLRYVRPLLFLRHQGTLVVDPIGSDAATQHARESLVAQVVEPILRVIIGIDEETSRAPNLPPRKKTFYRLREYIEQVLSIFGYLLVEQVGEEVAFDAARHESPDPIVGGESVRVVRPGLWEIATSTVVARAQVVAIDQVAAEAEGEERHD